ncbi:NAD(P)-dependent oxidoreductase [Rhodococcus sp. 06-470-2]|nr:NAD(P)-dependent oxidoreductase [Rhodococcus sp. 06-470-2]OZE66736.1 NAD(P)-dependent oxidoreductase [Rhodococcus sp. 05-2221-1B]OZF31715.1 NAD(P)-dependent oxidoreductase [Rhodococcus sp. 14-2496-1d]
MLALTTMLTLPTLAAMTSTALITGASSGLGEEFATRFAARGENVVLVARRADRLNALARRIEADHGVTATVVAMDLGVPGIGETLRTTLADRGITPTTLINNAGFGTHGKFADEDPKRVAAEIALNISALVDLTHAFLPNLTGALINVASTAAYQPTPNMAVYGATKAFVLNFTEALAFEHRASLLKILALSPGPTRTEFFDVVGSEDAAVGNFQTSEQVVATALRALDSRRTPASIVSGLSNKISAGSVRFAPRALATVISGRLLKA